LTEQAPVSSLSERFSPTVIDLTEETYGKDANGVLEALLKPVNTYYIRCNTLKISPTQLRTRLEDRGLRVYAHSILPEALGIKIEGPFEISSTKLQIVIDKHTAESVLQGANVYAPGVKNCPPIHAGDRVTVVSEIGDILANGTAAMNTTDILTFRKGLAVKIEDRRYKSPQIRDLPEFSEGLLYPQSLAAMITSHVLDPQKGESILDMNCAPGGKLSHLSQLMQASGRIVGLDRNADKIAQTRRTITTLGCSNVTLAIHDSRYVDTDFADMKPDRVLVDPPCSALGLRPKIYDQTKQERVDDLAEYQKQFIKAGSRAVKRGGVVVYSVCTFTTEECERIVEFAEEKCGLHTVKQKPFLGSKGLEKIRKSAIICQRFRPDVDEIGYFIAKFER
jgi:16S rRNA (cytosine967-C5)-methyltransferase